MNETCSCDYVCRNKARGEDTVFDLNYSARTSKETHCVSVTGRIMFKETITRYLFPGRKPINAIYGEKSQVILNDKLGGTCIYHRSLEG